MSMIRSERGFSLIELMLVMAITSSLAIIAFAGQRGIRSQAQFDGAVNRAVETLADARNEALAGVNTAGAGNGATGCGPAGQYVFAGVAWTADNTLPGSVLKVDYYEGLPGSAAANGACVFQTQSLSLPAQLMVTAPAVAGGHGARELFVRTNTGSVTACPVTNLTTDVRPSFRNGSCAQGTVTLTFTDADGHSSQVQVDADGLAKRLN